MAKKKTRRLSADDELNITSMMDMMTIILVFLLKSFSATEVNVTPSDNLRLPNSSSKIDPAVAVNVVIAKNQILVDDKPVVNVISVDDPRNPGQQTYQVPADERSGNTITKLYSAFETQAESAKSVASIAKTRDDMGFKGKVLLQIDQDVPFSLIRDVMFNAGQAQFAEFEFIVIKSGE
jgi:biopolymer transport protein ExbD